LLYQEEVEILGRGARSYRERRLILLLLRLAITAALIVAIARLVDVPRLFDTLKQVQLTICLAVCLLYPIGLLFSAWKLKWILEGYGMALGLGRSLDLNWTAGFVSNVLPTNIGGDVYRAVCLNRLFRDHSAKVLSSIVLDRGLGLLAMLVLVSVAGPLYVQSVLDSRPLAVGAPALCGVLAASAMWILFSRRSNAFWSRPKNRAGSWLFDRITLLLAFPDKRRIAYSLAASFGFTLLAILANYLLFLAFGAHISFGILLFVIPVVNLVGLVPISINGLGVTEGLGMYLFARLGIEPELALSVLLLARVLQFLCSSTGGVRLLLSRNLVPSRA
jgi:uncharacterized membrane protein YbhN (UPF0104 family)